MGVARLSPVIQHDPGGVLLSGVHSPLPQGSPDLPARRTVPEGVPLSGGGGSEAPGVSCDPGAAGCMRQRRLSEPVY
jgi:hypothetical protein